MVRRTRHAVYEIHFHFVWVPKYRRKVLVGGIPDRLPTFLSEKAKEMGGEIIDRAIQPGPGTGLLRKAFPHLKSQLPNMGRRSYYVDTARNVSAPTIQRYIDEQKGR